ncbi:MAG: HNH endonuclease [Deltaproteobacteria bacterium]|nr:HNH endonuclease [Deltaproteobacteria bacterium]
MGDLQALKGLSDGELLGGLQVAARRRRVADVEVIRLIAEVDARKLYREQACSSMFSFCVERLGMSEGATARRIRVARCWRELPAILDYLESGRIHLAGLYMLAPHLTRKNAGSVLERAVGKTQRQIEGLVAELAPKPAVPASIRKVASKQSQPPARAVGTVQPALQPPARAIVPAKPANIRPLAPARFHVSFTASEALKKNLDRARELAGHGATVEGLVEDAMALLVAELEKQKLGVRGRKAGKVANPRGRYVAKAVRREVFERDGGQCTYVDEHGRRCSERKGLHLDHVVPFARGGTSTAGNLRLRCGPHNQLAAEQCFGPLFIEARRQHPPPVKRE